MRDEQHWYRQLDGNPQHKTYVSTTPLPGVLDTIHQVSQVSKYQSHGQQNPSINHSEIQLCLLVDQSRNTTSINHMDSQLCLFVDRKRNLSINHMDSLIHWSTTRTASSVSLLVKAEIHHQSTTSIASSASLLI
jgi:hypothetical protein